MEKISFKTDLFIGENALDRLKEYENKKIFIVTDPFIVSSGMIDAVTSRIGAKNDFAIFSDIIPDPPIENVVAGISALNEFDGDMMVAIGGGSAIDAA
ncbi:MAG: iron-containing alcohol dehydrogenase, partial [Carnobacterium sp.]